jgi:hypothetical protein
MASFLLTPSNHKIPEIPGSQARFEKYFFKLLVSVPGASIVREINTSLDRIMRRHDTLDAYIQERKQEQLAWYQRVMSWRTPSDPWCKHQISIFQNLDSELILSMHALVRKKLSKKVRIDGSNHEIAFYFEDRSQLDVFLREFPSKYEKLLIRVENSLMATQELKVNQRVVKKRKTLPYKIFVRDQTRVQDSHRSFLQYLESLGPVVEIPRKMKKDFSSTDPQNYYHNLYFYTSDLSVVSFAELISPGIIGRVQEIVEIPKPPT